MKLKAREQIGLLKQGKTTKTTRTMVERVCTLRMEFSREKVDAIEKWYKRERDVCSYKRNPSKKG